MGDPVDKDEDAAHDGGDAHEDEQLGADEELDGHGDAEEQAADHGAASLPGQELVETEHQQGRHRRHRQHQMAVGEPDEDERGEPVE